MVGNFVNIWVLLVICGIVLGFIKFMVFNWWIFVVIRVFVSFSLDFVEIGLGWFCRLLCSFILLM